MRRRQRRLRSWWRHEQPLPRINTTQPHKDKRRPGPGRGRSEQDYTATIRETPPLQPELFEQPFGEEPSGARPDRLADVRPHVRVQAGTKWNTSSTSHPSCRSSMYLCRRWGEQLVDVLQFFDALLHVAEQLSTCPRSSSRTSRREPRFAGGTVGGSANNPVLPQAES